MLKYILFDVDDTLYPHDSPVWPMLRGRIVQYMIERLGMTPADAQALREKYLKEYGTSTRGLYLNDGIDIHDYLDYVHDLPLQQWLAPDPELDHALAQIPVEKCLFSNASRRHALNVTNALGISRHFTRVFALEDFDFISKPDPHPYTVVLARLQIDGSQCLFVEDSIPNLETAKQFGMTTVLVNGASPVSSPGVDYTIARAHEVMSVLARLEKQTK